MLYIWGTSKDIALFKKKVSSIYNPFHLQRKAVETGFYKRSSKLLPSKFFDILLYGASINGSCSLNQASCEIAESYGISISKQGLNDRYDASAVAFVRSIFEEQLSRQIDGTIHADFLKKFSRARIKDSTRFDIPERLKDNFRGYGGKITSEAAACIQYEFDVKNGKILDIDFTSAKRNDYQDAREKADDIQKDDLVIRDLGYFSTDVIKRIIENEAFFISRLHTKILAFTQEGKGISFSELHRKMIKMNQFHMEICVLIGKEEKVPVRLIIDIMPEEVYQNRLQKAEKECKKKGFQISEEYKARARFNLLITNAPQDYISGVQVYQLYRIRWQIELIFKIWKSTCGINKIHPMRYHRLMCFFYAKFIMILINDQIINLLQIGYYKKYGKLLSKDKCFKTLTIYFYKTRKALLKSNQKLHKFLMSIWFMLSKNHELEKRKKSISYFEIFNIFICVSNK